MRIKYISPFMLIVLLSGCSIITGSESVDDTGHVNGPQGTEGQFCVGAVMDVPRGLKAVEDSELLEDALGSSGNGKLCEGRVYEAVEEVTVYRVWNSEKSYTQYGRWWSFEQPVGPKSKYRKANGICPSWSELDVMSRCSIKVGAKVVVGPGQSAQCKDFTYSKSATNQVYINNDSRNNTLWIEDCSPGRVWPKP